MQSDRPSFFTITPHRAIISGSNTISQEGRDSDRMLSPETICNQNMIQILKSSPETTPAHTDIEPKTGTGRIVITDGSPSGILMVNTSTGGAIVSQA